MTADACVVRESGGVGGYSDARRPASPSSTDERRRLVTASLLVGNPGNNGRCLVEDVDHRAETLMEVEVELIHTYEGNPRQTLNPKFEEIKASIRQVGIRTPLAVTRRPGEAHYIVEAGGNTRLIAVRQLWQETREPRFQRTLVLVRPWKSERHVIGAHLVENELRGELSFWDKAVGIDALKRAIEVEEGRQLSLREVVSEFGQIGLTVGHGTVSYCTFAVERLRILGAHVSGLSGLDVRFLQPRLNALKRYAWDRIAMSEDVLYERVLDPLFSAAARSHVEGAEFNVTELFARCEAALSQVTGDSIDVLRARTREDGLVGGDRSPPGAPPSDAPSPEPPPLEDAPTFESPNRTGVSVPVVSQERLRQRLQAFVTVSGIADCLVLDGSRPLGLRLCSLPRVSAGGAMQERAWWFLAGLLGMSGPSERKQTVDAEFVLWLTDTRDAASSALWDLLELVRAPGGSLLRQTTDEAPTS